MAKSNAGRPKAITQEVLRVLEDAFSWGCTDAEACCHADIAPSTLYLYIKDNPKFSERKETLKDKPVMKAKRIVNMALDDGELPTAHKVIDRKEGQKVDITSGGKEIKNNFIIQPVTPKGEE